MVKTEYLEKAQVLIEADVLYEQGHLNTVVQKAIEMGFPKEQAIYCATYTPCQRMHFYDRIFDFFYSFCPLFHLCASIRLYHRRRDQPDFRTAL